MCVNYIYYFPSTELEVCKSSISDQALGDYFDTLNKYVTHFSYLDLNKYICSFPFSTKLIKEKINRCRMYEAKSFVI